MYLYINEPYLIWMKLGLLSSSFRIYSLTMYRMRIMQNIKESHLKNV